MLVTLQTIGNAGFRGSWGSGLATLVFADGSAVHADNGWLGRSLDDAFDCIGRGHSIDNRKLAGKQIVYWPDDFGLCLGGFIPYEAWLDAGLPELADGQSVEFDPETGEVELPEVADG